MQDRPHSAEAEEDEDLCPRAAVRWLAVLRVEHDVSGPCVVWTRQ